MSTASVGSFSKTQWANIESDAQKYLQLKADYGTLTNARESGADMSTKTGASLSHAYGTWKIGKGDWGFKANINKQGNFNKGLATGKGKQESMTVKTGSSNSNRRYNSAQQKFAQGGGTRAMRGQLLKKSNYRPQQSWSKAKPSSNNLQRAKKASTLRGPTRPTVPKRKMGNYVNVKGVNYKWSNSKNKYIRFDIRR
ncbi:MAG: hypothetical protein J6V44_03525 [Methanobrevibacter sp.]|nr:hypothetical protein [Methanobrevibacter sp.]